MNLSRTEITFLSDVPSDIDVDKNSGWRFNSFKNLTITEISTFIKSIEDDKTYLIIPLLCGSKSISKATLNLSDPFLINNMSNHHLIIKFIIDQWNSSGFTLKLDTQITFYIKYKRVWLSYK